MSAGKEIESGEMKSGHTSLMSIGELGRWGGGDLIKFDPFGSVGEFVHRFDINFIEQKATVGLGGRIRVKDDDLILVGAESEVGTKLDVEGVRDVTQEGLRQV